MPPAVGVRPSALRCAPRATNRAVTQPTFLAVMFVMLSPANRVFGYGSWIAAQRCVGAAEAAGLTTAARAGGAAARRAGRGGRARAGGGRPGRERMPPPIPRLSRLTPRWGIQATSSVVPTDGRRAASREAD